MPPFFKFGEIGALGKLAKLNSERLEPPNFRRDWSLPFGEIGAPRWLRGMQNEGLRLTEIRY